jgi:hypothetical protein
MRSASDFIMLLSTSTIFRKAVAFTNGEMNTFNNDKIINLILLLN